MESDPFKQTRRMILSRVLLVPFAIVMLVCGTLVYYFADNLREQVVNELILTADGHHRLIEQFLDERASDLRFTAESFDFEKLGGNGNLRLVLEHLQNRSRAFLDLGMFDKEGNHIAYVGPYDLKGKNYARADWFKAVRDRGFYISDVFLGYRNIAHFVIAVEKKEGDRVMYLRATIDTLYFNNLVENIRIGKTGEAYLINRDGVLQTRRRSGGSLMDIDPDHDLYGMDEKKITSFSLTNREGERHLYATGLLPQTGWLLVVRQEISDAYAPLVRAVLVAVTFIVGGGAIVVFMAFILATGLANRLSIADLEKKEMTNQLIMAGKLAEVGEMSAGVAHEINNPLQVMKSENAMMNEILGEVADADGNVDKENMALLKDSIDQISLQIDRCKQITMGLLKFARKSEPVLEKIDIGTFLQEVVAMVVHKAEVENIRIIRKIDAGLPQLSADPSQLQQVFLNLLNNSIDAVREKHGGEIRISSKKESGAIAISVTDNGKGIPADQLEKIFLPFYTTKPVGQGTGLGLSTCFGIVDGMGGKITVTSEENAGSVFTIWFPLGGSEIEAKAS